MTYFGFLLRFLIPPILLLLLIYWRAKDRSVPGFDGARFWRGILIHIALAVTYTTPWDNYVVATGVWYYNPDLVTGIVIGYVPIEEYTFFVVETILSGLWWWFLARRITPHRTRSSRTRYSIIFPLAFSRQPGLYLPIYFSATMNPLPIFQLFSSGRCLRSSFN